jgi:uncharacterized damage-inducible protein DinB/glutaredoxin
MTTVERSDTIEAYWVPGCSSCLRMKEFMQRSGKTFEAINLEEHPERGARLKPFGLVVPAVVRGDRAVAGLDLAGIAELIGIDYTPPQILPAAVLKDRYDAVSETMLASVGQLSAEQLSYKSPDRDRDLATLACHIGSIMRSFLDAYDGERYDHSLENPKVPLRTPDEIIGLGQETHRQFTEWWERFGFDDPLDRVIQTSWGPRTLLEALERSVWHPMQHTRQLTFFVEERLGITPARRLTSAELAGLPLPEGIHAGGEGV